MNNFTPETKDEKAHRLGYKSLHYKQSCLEDGLSGYTSKRSPGKWASEINDLLTAAGADHIGIMYGMAETRPAARLRFVWENVPVEIVQVTLPIRGKITRVREDQAMRQAFYHLYNEVRFELERRHFHPNTPAFVTYMLTPSGDTIAQLITNNAPLAIASGNDQQQGIQNANP